MLSKKEIITQVKQLETPNIPVGIFPDAEYINNFCKVEQFSSLYVFSDGAYEIHLENGTIWDIEAFIELLKNYHNFQECNLDKILNYLLALNPKDAFDDDLSILQINFN